jgi:lysophospholipase L1-like esterase
MPLGASITYGEGSTDGNGYRERLKDILLNDGNPTDFVGSQQSGNMTDNQNEGWPGAIISEVFDRAKSSVPSMLPNLVLINAGTNDCKRDIDVKNAHTRTLEMMEWLWAASPRATIILSTLLPNKGNSTEKNVLEVNTNLKIMVAEQQAISKKVTIVDMHGPDGPQTSDLMDEAHPNDAGYDKMALLWLTGIRDAASRGWLEEPQALQ